MEPIHDLPAWPPTREEMRDYIRSLPQRRRTATRTGEHVCTVCRAPYDQEPHYCDIAVVRARLEAQSAAQRHEVEEPPKWTPPPIPEPVQAPQFKAKRNGGWVSS